MKVETDYNVWEVLSDVVVLTEWIYEEKWHVLWLLCSINLEAENMSGHLNKLLEWRPYKILIATDREKEVLSLYLTLNWSRN
jgi:hypothetical protein